jgi:hypothetical protein
MNITLTFLSSGLSVYLFKHETFIKILKNYFPPDITEGLNEPIE